MQYAQERILKTEKLLIQEFLIAGASVCLQLEIYSFLFKIKRHCV
jgi:hypothetical protein